MPVAPCDYRTLFGICLVDRPRFLRVDANSSCDLSGHVPADDDFKGALQLLLAL
jgi:hypothetical protein